MRNRALMWVVAAFITLVSAVYQRMTGPTYPARGTVTLGGQELKLRLLRTHGGPGDQPVVINAADTAIVGEVAWRRYPTQDAWQRMPLVRDGAELRAALPHQPTAGKLEYQVHLVRGTEQVVFPARPAITRFRNAVPASVLIPHVSAMFFFMLFATAAALGALARAPQVRRDTYIAMALLAVGGFFLGPLMQYIAFGAWWTGIPFGWDLTDNKTLFAAIAWAVVAWRMRGGRAARNEIIAAAVVTLVVFAIPHSTWGSEVDWSKLPAGPTP
ncbi:MAG: hypothetical protein H3C62_13775 [Gemmatimonadaceae bacterium]|nr:hypothetical protein [Gemmatimonadaceae bacterium]